MTTPTPNSIRPASKIVPVEYMRKPFYVNAVQITKENLKAIADWTDGEIEIGDDGESFVRVKVLRPLNDRQTRGNIGDWVLKSNTGFKVYTDSAFSRCFDVVMLPDVDESC